ncbi:MAG TPA: Uma2 family endonuclease [Planctomycetaceae bacterium]|nr:Uma2 family endonuclease [Planctomycetaceae bacterium]
MSSTLPATNSEWTAADLMRRFGPIPLSRVRTRPAPGTATEQDVVSIHSREKRLCELVDGILVEKTVGYFESAVAIRLVMLLGNFLKGKNIGQVFGPDGMMKLEWGLIRIPDVCFVSSERLRTVNLKPHAPLDVLSPNLAIEVLSAGNTAREMEEKLHDYFSHGVELVWYCDPVEESVTVYRSPGDSRVVQHPESLTGEPVLPGFVVSLPELFAPLVAP